MKKFIAVAGILGGLALPAIAQSWSQYDHNRDGQVTFRELRNSGVQINQQVRQLDRNNDRVLSRRELRNVQFNNYGTYQQPYYNQQPYTTNNQGYHWSTLDTNRNGVLESYELNRAGYQTNTNYNMNTYDLNRDGYIDQYEQQRMNGSGNAGSTILNLMQILPGLLNR